MAESFRGFRHVGFFLAGPDVETWRSGATELPVATLTVFGHRRIKGEIMLAHSWFNVALIGSPAVPRPIGSFNLPETCWSTSTRVSVNLRS